jgi:putative hydrolases of HD superfamily
MPKKKKKQADSLLHVVDFLFEVGILAKTPRSGFYFWGNNEQSVAEHINRAVYVGYVLACMEKNVDTGKVMKMCLLHDLAESRVSDLNWTHQKYVQRNEKKAIHDMTAPLPFGKDMLEAIEEYEERKSQESILAKDADSIELLLSLREEIDIGNSRANTLIPPLLKRLKTTSAKRLAKKIMKTSSDHWWFADQHDQWWINRNQKS